jgi:hypothetical protein
MTRREIAQELFLTVAVAAGLALSLWRIYGSLVHDTDPAREAFGYILLNHADAFTFGMIALLASAVLLDWMHYRRAGVFAALTPFRAIAAVVAVALLVWTGVRGA